MGLGSTQATVLIAEDDPASRHVLELLLAPKGYWLAFSPDFLPATGKIQKLEFGELNVEAVIRNASMHCAQFRDSC